MNAALGSTHCQLQGRNCRTANNTTVAITVRPVIIAATHFLRAYVLCIPFNPHSRLQEVWLLHFRGWGPEVKWLIIQSHVVGLGFTSISIWFQWLCCADSNILTPKCCFKGHTCSLLFLSFSIMYFIVRPSSYECMWKLHLVPLKWLSIGLG